MINPHAGQRPSKTDLVDISALIKAYYNDSPDPLAADQLVQFGTSGHRGSSFKKSFNEAHILAITQAICQYRESQNINGPLYLGKDTHALSMPALKTALEVLAANGVTVMLSKDDEPTPTPAISRAILVHNAKKQASADGIVMTPSHNPPEEGGFKYNPPNGGPAEPFVTDWIQDKANEHLKNKLKDVKRIGFEKAILASTTKRFDYLLSYVEDLKNVIDLKLIAESKIKIGVDPLGGAGVHYWKKIAEVYGLEMNIVSETIDPTFSFMSLDWDGKIRMDPSSPYAMQGLIGMKDRFDISFACDTDYDRHGIVTKSAGLLQPNHYLVASIFYLFQNRPGWKKQAGVGKTVVSSQMIDRVTKKLNRPLYEVPVGFKWFVEGLLDGSLGFVGEESAGGSFLRFDGTSWSTDKDGIMMALLSAEMTARLGKDPGELYQALTLEFGNPAYGRIEAKATAQEKKILKNLSSENVKSKTLGGEKILRILTKAPGNNAPIGGVKVETENAFFAARPSGTEDIYKIYGESFLGQKHLDQILEEAKSVVNEAMQRP